MSQHISELDDRVTTNISEENIGPRERKIAKQYNIHKSWLEPAVPGHGEICYCCKKLRDHSHYLMDRVICVFCQAVCGDNATKCQVRAVK